jgi:hypothetical protein
MKRNTQLTIDFDEVLLWTNWIDCASRRLSFPRPPAELLVLFVVQSLELAHSLDLMSDCRQKFSMGMYGAICWTESGPTNWWLRL